METPHPVKLTVLGAGPGGYAAAIRAAQLGAEVTLVERERVGGTCLNWGCVPTKVFKSAADTLEQVRRAGRMGLAVTAAAAIDLQVLATRQAEVVRIQADGIHRLLRQHHVRYLKGEGTIPHWGAMRVQLPDGGTETLAWERLILATGSRPANLPALPFDGRRIWSSNHVLALTRLPRSLVIIGAGVIGCEFASILNAFGVQVTLVEMLSRLLPLPAVDADGSKLLQREMRKRDIAIHLNHRVSGCRVTADDVEVLLEPLSGEGDPSGRGTKTCRAEGVLVCVGRIANTAGLGLEGLGIATDAHGGIQVDARLQTAVEGIFAVGDVLGPARPMLAHVATHEGLRAAENALGASRAMDYNAVPLVVYSCPELSGTGLSEAQARARGLPVSVTRVLFRNVAKAHILGAIEGEAKIVAHAEGGRILGLHLVGPEAAELIAEGVAGLQAGLTVDELADHLHAHPTLSEIWQEAALKAAGRPLHG